MSISKRIAFAIGVSWISRFVTIGANLVLIPLFFRYIGKEALGIWFLLGNSQAFLNLLGMGVAPTLARQIALAKGKSGANPNVELTEESKREISNLIVTGQIVLRWLAIMTFLVASITGYILIGRLKLEEVSLSTVLLSWLIMCIGYAIGVWTEYLNCILMGMGQVGWNRLAYTLVLIGNFLINIVWVISGGGLVGLAIIFVITNLFQRFLLLSFLHKYQSSLLLLEKHGRWCSKLAKSLIEPSLKCWATIIGSFLILKTDQYFIAIASGTKNIPAYHAAYQLVSNLRVLALSIAFSSAPFLSQMWQAGNIKQIHKLVIKSCRITLIIMAFGCSFLILTGESVINIWLGDNNFIGYPILITFCIMLSFEAHNSYLISTGRAIGNEDFAFSSLIAGLLNIILTFILIKPLGLWGVSLSTLFALMLTNNWFTIYRVTSRLRIGLIFYIKKVGFLFVSCFILNFAIILIAKTVLIKFNYYINNEYVLLIVSGLVSLTFFCGNIWILFLDFNVKKALNQISALLYS